VVLGANAIGGAYIGARYPFISTNGGNGVSTPSPVLSGLVTAGIGALLWLVIVGTSFPLGKPQPVPVSDAKWWLQNVADSLVVAGTEVDSDKNIRSLTALPKSYIKNYNISGLNHARQYRTIFGKTDYETNLVISSLKQNKFKQTSTFSLGPEDNAIDLIDVFPDNDSIGNAVIRFVTDDLKTVGSCKLVADKFPKYAFIAEQRAFDIASKQNTLGELQEFLKLFPNTSLRSKAEKKQTEILYNSYKQDYQACKTADDYTNFIAKHKSKDYDKLIPKAQERVKQLRYKEYKDMFANAKNGYDYAAFIGKYAANDPDNLIPRAKAAEYQKLYEEAYSSSDCSRFMEKYANNDPNGYIPKVQEKRAVALEREEQERIAEARRQEERRKEREKLRNRLWDVQLGDERSNTYYQKTITEISVSFNGKDEQYGSYLYRQFAPLKITYNSDSKSYEVFMMAYGGDYGGSGSGNYISFNIHYVERISRNGWEYNGAHPSEYSSIVQQLCRKERITQADLINTAVQIFTDAILRKPRE
jgi:hypothetical protein